MTKLVYTSPNLEKFISADDLHYLAHICLIAEEEKYLRTTLNDRIGAVSFIMPIRDEYNREGVWNHTFIFKLKDYFNETQPTQLFASKFKRPEHNERLVSNPAEK